MLNGTCGSSVLQVMAILSSGGSKSFTANAAESCSSVGGRPRQNPDNPELLPNDPDLDGLPDAATSQLFEDLSHDDFAVFWPSRGRDPLIVPYLGDWRPASLDPASGQVKRLQPGAKLPEGLVRGHLYHRPAETLDRHKRKAAHPSTAVPYECPACATDYSLRGRGYRLSPLRSFRTGFAKTTQLLATELFDLLRLYAAKNEAKLVSFSDSRQDAAHAALDIERRHHEDVRRQLLIETARRILASRPAKAVIDADVEKTKEEIKARVSSGNFELEDLQRRLKELGELAGSAGDTIVRIADLIEVIAEPDKFQGNRSRRTPLRPVLRRFVELGIHPIDPAGIARVELGRDPATYKGRKVEWDRLFLIAEPHTGSIDWFDPATAHDQSQFDDARKSLVDQAQDLITDVIFNKTYFSLEETGLGYPCIQRGTRSPDEFGRLNAFLRVLGDAYRFDDSKWNDYPPRGWQKPEDIWPTSRVSRFAHAVWPDDTERTNGLQGVLESLGAEGHKEGLLSNSHICIRLVDEEHPYWRCGQCARAHLHRGAGICTRCFQALAEKPTGMAKELRRNNFLARRIERPGSSTFRLHCEELTGQTDHPADRQRKFKGIILPLRRSVEDPRPPYREKEIIDLLAVTTTMEVGIDIGPLRTVFQANMPPQRFNYQQRVGRAGRRGQAFSMVLTVCRSKSHDLHYFRHPEEITGKLPPPPFLTKTQPTVPRRFIRKAWLCRAFEILRDECQASGEVYPGDSMFSPDIHGEFAPTDVYFAGESPWPVRLEKALNETIALRDAMARTLAEDSTLSAELLLDGLDPKTIIEEIHRLSIGTRDALQEGLAHSLAEAGLFPMYGMPTRVRDLYIGFQKKPGVENEEYLREWKTIDRDIDLGIFEHARRRCRQGQAAIPMRGLYSGAEGFSLRHEKAP